MPLPEPTQRPNGYTGTILADHHRDLIHSVREALGLFSPTPFVVLARTSEAIHSQCLKDDTHAWIACSSLTSAKAYLALSESSPRTKGAILAWYDGTWLRIDHIAETTVEPVTAPSAPSAPPVAPGPSTSSDPSGPVVTATPPAT